MRGKRCSKMPPGSAPERLETEAPRSQRAAVENPDDHTSAHKQQTLEKQCHRERQASAAGPQPAQLLGLELYVSSFVLDNLLAQPQQDAGVGRPSDRGIVHLGDDFSRDEYGD